MRSISSILLFSLMLLICCTPKSKIAERRVSVQPETEEAKYLWVVKPTVNVRKTHSTAAAKVARLMDGDSVKILNNVNGWYQVILAGKKKGWIRSDLLAPREYSPFLNAQVFAEQQKSNYGIHLFFDKKLLHKRIFIRFPKNRYSAQQSIRGQARTVASAYQNQVYSGDITMIVLSPDSDDPYLTLNYNGRKNADLILPVISYGILEKLIQNKQTEITLIVRLTSPVKNSELLLAARKMAGKYPVSYNRVQVNFIDEHNNCILSFVEDASGEHFKNNRCL